MDNLDKESKEWYYYTIKNLEDLSNKTKVHFFGVLSKKSKQCHQIDYVLCHNNLQIVYICSNKYLTIIHRSGGE